MEIDLEILDMLSSLSQRLKMGVKVGYEYDGKQLTLLNTIKW